MNHTEKLEQRIAELERQVASHWKTRAKLMEALQGIEGISKLALDYADDYREGHNKAHGLE
tara:strand:+ start:403 stop:585 length:183 start_codon:yes stop_codon:yes gene_type:complete